MVVNEDTKDDNVGKRRIIEMIDGSHILKKMICNYNIAVTFRYRTRQLRDARRPGQGIDRARVEDKGYLTISLKK